MKLKGKEKNFWWDFARIKDPRKIPDEIPGFTSIDSIDDDEYLVPLFERVKIIHSLYFKETRITDETVRMISNVQQLKSLTLMKHPKITPKSLPYLNQLTDLEYLDVWRTEITLKDIYQLDHLKNLKELYVASLGYEFSTHSQMDSELILEEVINLESILPNCKFYVDHHLYR
ncbi:hypothetical protein SAMN05443633_11374 [Chryseobacterium arachidis]|uniref:Leucine Rich repeat-containing protein n=1 Tax=Chryseobacterium arachidis TaxID=1416778 RepID=A0A1M5IUP9_9FLAO|nr:hypothetical protein [Chryseobacterium arachidis]SHG32001.1 hypothetical protein SAMN05443633_11374 [Chryseobacterium arachidis]